MNETPYLAGGYDESSGSDYSAASLCLVTGGNVRVLMSAVDNLSPAIRAATNAIDRFYYLLARTYNPRVAHLAFFAKKERTRKKNRRRIEKEIARQAEQEKNRK